MLSQATGNAPNLLDSLSVLGQILAADAGEDATFLLSLVVNHAITRRMARDRSQQLLQSLKQTMLLAYLFIPALAPYLMAIAAPAFTIQHIVYGTVTGVLLGKLWPQPYAAARAEIR